jgi:thiol-disulfide isomerase/thioredoxin
LALALGATGCSGGQVNDTSGNGLQYIQGDGTVTRYDVGNRQLAPALSGTTLDGKPAALADHRGDVVVLNVWASWCAPCRAEAPTLAALADQLGSHAVTFLGVNTRDNQTDALAFQRAFHLPYPSIADEDGAQLLGFGAATPATIPSTIVIDRQGRVAARVSGEVTAKGLHDLIDQIKAEGGGP